MERLTERTGEGQAIPRMDLKNNGHQRCMERLAEYEDLEELNRLLKLPCAVGDTVFEIYKGEIIERIVRGILFRGGELWGQDGNGSNFGIFEKTVFLTREEAEAALKALEG